VDDAAQNAFDIYGSIKEGVHVAGYSFERACNHLEWLLEENRWQLEGRFSNVNDFLDSVKLDQFRIVTDQRKRIAQRIRELQPDASQRAIARVVGAGEATVRRDLSDTAPNGASANREPEVSVPRRALPAPNGAPSAGLSGAAVAKLVEVSAAKQEKAEAKKADRIQAGAEIASRNAALPADERTYSVIYADPPWSFQVWSGEGKDRAAENHYPTMEQRDIEALPVGALAAENCALFMWAVMPQLPEALAVIKAWGFEFKTCAFVWVKQTKDEERFATGMGYWTRANAEICLLATRGNPVRLHADVHQVVLAPRMEHSRKPDEVAERIQRLVPGPYIELFARRQREGWDVWGNQAEAA
jgi:N6-adenosine-specific RNA methylase IME4